jgi:hypothetical protein
MTNRADKKKSNSSNQNIEKNIENAVWDKIQDSIDIESEITKRIESNIEKIITEQIKGYDLNKTIQQIIIKNQEQIFGQALKGISTSILGQNSSDIVGSSMGQTMGSVANILQQAFVRYL